MQVTNEIREAFLMAVPMSACRQFVPIAFEAVETDQLMKWLTLQEKVEFGKRLLELVPDGFYDRTLNSDLTEDR